MTKGKLAEKGKGKYVAVLGINYPDPAGNAGRPGRREMRVEEGDPCDPPEKVAVELLKQGLIRPADGSGGTVDVSSESDVKG